MAGFFQTLKDYGTGAAGKTRVELPKQKVTTKSRKKPALSSTPVSVKPRASRKKVKTNKGKYTQGKSLSELLNKQDQDFAKRQ